MKFMSTDDISIVHEEDEDDEDELFLDDDESTDNESLNGSVHVAREDIRLMNVVRAIIILILLTLAFILSEVAFVISTLQNENNFRAAYSSAANELVDAFYTDIETKLWATQTLATEISSSVEDQEWPFVSIPNFQARCEAPMYLAQASSIYFSPFVDAVTLPSWETFAADTYQSTILQDPAINNVTLHVEYLSTKRTVSEGVYYFKESTAFTVDTRTSGNIFPIWQAAPRPPVNISKGIQATLFGQSTPVRAQALDSMVLRGGSTASTWLFNQTDLSDFAFYSVPETVITYPLRQGLSQESQVVGAISLQYQWEPVLAGAVKEIPQPLYAVIENSCGGNFTYVVEGVDASFVGQGNLVEKTELSFTLVNTSYATFARLFDRHGDVPVDPDTACNYMLMVFPTPEFESYYHNFYPNMFRGVVLLIFFCVIVIFIFYDCVVEDRQSKVVNQAQRSDAIVRSLFPDAVRDKLYQNAIKKEEEQKLLNKRNLIEAPKHTLKKMLAEDPDDPAGAAQGSASEPIADLFPHATIVSHCRILCCFLKVRALSTSLSP